jgi:hypothetical protein
LRDVVLVGDIDDDDIDLDAGDLDAGDLDADDLVELAFVDDVLGFGAVECIGVVDDGERIGVLDSNFG